MGDVGEALVAEQRAGVLDRLVEVGHQAYAVLDPLELTLRGACTAGNEPTSLAERLCQLLASLWRVRRQDNRAVHVQPPSLLKVETHRQPDAERSI